MMRFVDLLPMGNAPLWFVTTLLQVAAAILQEPEKWENQVLNMTGPEDLTMSDIVKT